MNKAVSILVAAAAVALLAGQAAADPLAGQILKFQQVPMDGMEISVAGATQKYWGHDELSTAWSRYTTNPTNNQTEFVGYKGMFMADDFADRFRMPVVHVRWWGSYINNEIIQPVDKFLIAFETDIPQGPLSGDFSKPGEVLLSQIVTKGPLAPGSGTYTETLITPASAAGASEALYEYNAELALPFNQKPCEIYWLKVVALVDVDPDIVPGPDTVTQWGWHNRDWTVKDDLACTVDEGVDPGEAPEGYLNNDRTLPVWHFQDDAVQGQITVPAPIEADNPTVEQLRDTFQPQYYRDILDGPDGISQYSKDLAFELYTIPEPATMLLLGLGGVTTLLRRRR